MRKMDQRNAGSITLEAAFLVPLLLILLIALLGEGMVLHDRLVVKAILERHLYALRLEGREPENEDGSLNMSEITSEHFYSVLFPKELNLTYKERQIEREILSATLLVRDVHVSLNKTLFKLSGEAHYQIKLLDRAYFNGIFKGISNMEIKSELPCHIRPEEYLRVIHRFVGE